VAAFRWHKPVGPNRLHFNDAKSGRRGLKRKPRAFRTAIVQHIENELRVVERPLEVDQFEPQIPFSNAGLPSRILCFAIRSVQLAGVPIVVGYGANDPGRVDI